MGSYLGFRPTKSGRYFFISYKRVDMERIAPIAAELDRMGIPLWYDEDIGYGAEWEAVLAEKIRNSLGVLLFVTQDTFEKTDTGINYVQLEYKVAKRSGKEIIPVFLERVDVGQIPAEYSFWFEDLSGIQGVEVRNLSGTGENSAAQAIFRKLDPIYRGRGNARTAAGFRNAKTTAGFRSARTAEGEPAGRKETEDARNSGFGKDHVTGAERTAAEENRRDFQEWRRRKEKKQRGVLVLAVIMICIGALIVFLVVRTAGRHSALPGNGDGSMPGTETSGATTEENALIPAEGVTGAGEAASEDDGSAAAGAADAPLSGDSLSTDSSVMEDNGSGEDGASGDASGTADVSNSADDSQGIQDASSAASAADTGAADSSDASASSSGVSDGSGEDSQTQDNGSSDEAGESTSTGGSQGTSSADAGSSGGTTDSAGVSSSGAAAAGTTGSGTSDNGNGTASGNGTSAGTGSSGGSISSAGNSSSGGTSDSISDSSSGSPSGNGNADSSTGNSADASGAANG